MTNNNVLSCITSRDSLMAKGIYRFKYDLSSSHTIRAYYLSLKFKIYEVLVSNTITCFNLIYLNLFFFKIKHKKQQKLIRYMRKSYLF